MKSLKIKIKKKVFFLNFCFTICCFSSCSFVRGPMNVDVVVVVAVAGSFGIIRSSLKQLGPVRIVTASAISLPALFNTFRFKSRSVKPILTNVSILSSIFNKSVDVDDETIEHEIFSIEDEDAVNELLLKRKYISKDIENKIQ